jgi:ketosteroid isomerase-like protein
MPAGQYPLTSRETIKAFWWPADGSRTQILTFSRGIDELQGTADVAYLRGMDSLTYSYEKGGVRSQVASRSMTLAVLRRERDGQWRISRMMWGARRR